MSTYKITNITNLTGKREPRFNTVLDINYVDSMMNKTVKIKPGETVFLTINSLPLSVHKLRVKKLISVVEVSERELKSSMREFKPIEVPVNEVREEKLSTTSKKKNPIKKSHDTEIAENE